MENLKARVHKVVKRVQRMIKPEVRTNKEIIINAESLETRVAVQVPDALEEFTIERTTEERLVGSVFSGKSPDPPGRRLESRLCGYWH